MPPRIHNNSHVNGRGALPETITHDSNISLPVFPLSDVTPAEQSYWDELWNTHPLNGWWSERGVERELALYVRTTLLAESKPSAPLLAQVRGMRSDLGISAVGAKSQGLVYSMGSGIAEGDDWWE